MRLILHGTGAGKPCAERGASALSMEWGDGSITVFDAGEACSRGMLRDGVDLQRITTVAVSHTHADHWCGLPALLVAWGMSRRTDPVDLYLPPGSLEFFDRVFITSYTLPERLPFQLNFYELGTFAPGDGWQVVPLPTTHLDKYKDVAGEHGLPYPAFGYLLKKGDRRIVLSQDIGSVDDLVDIMEGAELVVCEATHVAPRSVLQMAQQQNVRQVLFTHIPPGGADFPDVFEGVEWRVVADGYSLTL